MFDPACNSVLERDVPSTEQDRPRPAAAPGVPDVKELMCRAIGAYRRLWQAGERVDPADFARSYPGISEELCAALNALIVFQWHPDLLDTPLPEEDWPHAGDVFLGLRLDREISRGSFGRVFQGIEPALGDRAVAVKVAHCGDHEARTLGRLEHRNVVPVYSVSHHKKTGLTAVCMPYLGSTTLQDVAARARPGRLPARADIILDTIRGKDPLQPPSPAADPVLRKGSYVRGIVHLGAQIADALAYVHARGVAHLDLKPSNVLLTAEGRPMLVDFHLALDRNTDCVRLGGTVPYTSPEQLEVIDRELAACEEIQGRGEEDGGFSSSSLVTSEPPQVTETADVFSVGVMLYELLAGFNPFAAPAALKGRAQVAHVRCQQQQGPRPLHLVNPQVAPGLALLVDRCLALESAERPTACELAARLRRSQRGLRPLLSRCAVPLACVLLLLLPTFFGGAVWLSHRTAPVRSTPADEGRVAFAQGHFEAAEVRFKKALEREPDSAELLFWLARTETRLGNLIEAEAYYRKADTLSARGDVQASRAYNLLLMGSYPEQALQENRRALASGFESARLHNNLAWSAMQLGRLDDADRALRRAIELAPDFQGAYLNRVLLEMHRANREPGYLPLRGVADLRRALELGPVPAESSFYGAVLCADVATRAERRADINRAEHTRLAKTYVRQAIEKGYRLSIIQSHPRLGGLLASLPALPKAKVPPEKAVRPAFFFDPLVRQ